MHLCVCLYVCVVWFARVTSFTSVSVGSLVKSCELKPNFAALVLPKAFSHSMTLQQETLTQPCLLLSSFLGLNRSLIASPLPPQVNFVGKLLGPGGSTIKRLQEETGAKISVLGKGSMRDKNKVCDALASAAPLRSRSLAFSCSSEPLPFVRSAGGGAAEGRRSQICSPGHGTACIYWGDGTHTRSLSANGARHGRGQEVPHSGAVQICPLHSSC